MLKKVELPEDMLYALCQLSDAEAGAVIKAIGNYVHNNETPQFKENKSLAFVFSIFKTGIDAQLVAAAERSKTNTENALKKTAKKKPVSKKSESHNANTEASDPLTFEQMEAVYPKKDATADYRNASISLWNALDASVRQSAYSYVETYKKTFTTGDGMPFLSQYLKSSPWSSASSLNNVRTFTNQ